jgi:hypothetical protein
MKRAYLWVVAVLFLLLLSAIPAFAGDLKPPAPTLEIQTTPTGHSAALSWKASTSAGVTYFVYGGVGPGGEATTAINTIAISGLVYTDASSAFLLPGNNVCYVVKAFLATNTAGTQFSVASNESCGVVPTNAPAAPVQNPAQVSGLVATPSTTAVAILLKWSPVTTANDGKPLLGPVYYDVRRCQTSLNPCSKPTQLLLNASPLICNSYLDDNLVRGAKYAYWIQATNLTYGGAWSVGVSAVAP